MFPLYQLYPVHDFPLTYSNSNFSFSGNRICFLVLSLASLIASSKTTSTFSSGTIKSALNLFKRSETLPSPGNKSSSSSIIFSKKLSGKVGGVASNINFASSSKLNLIPSTISIRARTDSNCFAKYCLLSSRISSSPVISISFTLCNSSSASDFNSARVTPDNSTSSFMAGSP